MEQNLRMTHQRETILAELKKYRSHPTADELYERIKKRLPRISLATVYRNLEILSSAGLIRKLEISGRQKRFDGELTDHNHIYCVQCHRIDNIEQGKSNSIAVQPNLHKGYEISGCRIEFYGVCPCCQKKNTTTKNTRDTAMACKPKGLSDKQRVILEALANSSDPCGSKDIAAATNLEAKQVSCQITALKKKGLVASPVRCKYAITSEGKGALA
ncbi:MAG: Fur family transcriptional regulator [Desulfobulbus propionicus]|nr:MAG: Fur family transcriptional regulator [Desulfobulbus propionicus]PIE60296.1 MAG: Fur family transcriptional regulator [Desulfobulbus propionicus]